MKVSFLIIINSVNYSGGARIPKFLPANDPNYRASPEA